MNKTISMFVLWATIVATLLIQSAFAQQKAPVKVKSSEVVTGVVIVHVQKEGRSLELQCNEGAFNCKPLSSGSYMMVELPKNFGMYDCKNVEIYQGDQDRPEATEKIGAYCLVEK